MLTMHGPGKETLANYWLIYTTLIKTQGFLIRFPYYTLTSLNLNPKSKALNPLKPYLTK